MNQWPPVSMGNVSSWKAAAQGNNTLHTNTVPPSAQAKTDSKAQHFRAHSAPHNQTLSVPEGTQLTGFWSYDDIIEPLKNMPFHVVCLLFDTTATALWSLTLNLRVPDLAHSAPTQNTVLVHEKGKNLWRELRKNCVVYIIHLLNNLFSFRWYYCLSKIQVKKIWC